MNSETVLFSREIPIRRWVEVLVAGGGPAGIVAALARQNDGRMRSVPISDLLTALKKAGAYLPNTD